MTKKEFSYFLKKFRSAFASIQNDVHAISQTRKDLEQEIIKLEKEINSLQTTIRLLEQFPQQQQELQEQMTDKESLKQKKQSLMVVVNYQYWTALYQFQEMDHQSKVVENVDYSSVEISNGLKKINTIMNRKRKLSTELYQLEQTLKLIFDQLQSKTH